MALKIKFNNLDRQYRNLRSEILDATDTVLRSGQVISGTQALEIVAEYLRHQVLDSDRPRVLIPTIDL